MPQVSGADGWDSYLHSFHAQRPGITESVLAACSDEAFASPYEWLVDGLNENVTVLDLACGSGPTQGLVPKWIGIDRAAAELRGAQRRGRDDLIRGDAGSLPIRSGSVDVVVCSMALMLIEPVEHALAEIERVLTPTGELRALIATQWPISPLDIVSYTRLFMTSRSVPRFPPTPLRRRAGETLADAGLRLDSDRSRRFDYAVNSPADLHTFVNSWYVPGRPVEESTSPKHWPNIGSIGVPFRRIVARPF